MQNLDKKEIQEQEEPLPQKKVKTSNNVEGEESDEEYQISNPSQSDVLEKDGEDTSEHSSIDVDEYLKKREEIELSNENGEQNGKQDQEEEEEKCQADEDSQPDEEEDEEEAQLDEKQNEK